MNPSNKCDENDFSIYQQHSVALGRWEQIVWVLKEHDTDGPVLFSFVKYTFIFHFSQENIAKNLTKDYQSFIHCGEKSLKILIRFFLLSSLFVSSLLESNNLGIQ